MDPRDVQLVEEQLGRGEWHFTDSYRNGRRHAFAILKLISDFQVDPSAEQETIEHMQNRGTLAYRLGVRNAIHAWYTLKGK